MHIKPHHRYIVYVTIAFLFGRAFSLPRPVRSWEGTNSTLSPGYVEGFQGNFSNIYVDSGIYLNGVLKNDILAYPSQPVNFLVFRSGSTYYGKNTTSGQIEHSNADPAVCIENVWSDLVAIGGGTFQTVGSGETWTFQTQVNDQGANVTWLSDWSLTFTIPNSFDAIIVYVTSADNIVFWGLHINGNKAGQTTGSGPGCSSSGIEFVGCSHIKVLYCWVEDCAKMGIAVRSYNTDDYDAEVAHCFCDGNGWNGIEMGYSNSDPTNSRVFVHHNYVSHSGDVGITSYSDYSEISNNIVADMDGILGDVNSQTCYGVEGGGVRIPTGVMFTENIALNGKQGIVFYEGKDHVFADGHIYNMSTQGCQFQNGTVNCKISGTKIKECVSPIAVQITSPEDGRHIIENNDVFNEVTDITNWSAYIKVNSNGTIIKNNRIWSKTGQTNIFGGILIDGQYEDPIVNVEITGNTIFGFTGAGVRGIYIQNNTTKPIVKNNNIYNCTIGIGIKDATSSQTIILENIFDSSVGTKISDNGTGTITRDNEGYTELGDIQISGTDIQMYNGTAWITIGSW